MSVDATGVPLLAWAAQDCRYDVVKYLFEKQFPWLDSITDRDEKKGSPAKLQATAAIVSAFRWGREVTFFYLLRQIHTQLHKHNKLKQSIRTSSDSKPLLASPSKHNISTLMAEHLTRCLAEGVSDSEIDDLAQLDIAQGQESAFLLPVIDPTTKRRNLSEVLAATSVFTYTTEMSYTGNVEKRFDGDAGQTLLLTPSKTCCDCQISGVACDKAPGGQCDCVQEEARYYSVATTEACMTRVQRLVPVASFADPVLIVP